MTCANSVGVHHMMNNSCFWACTLIQLITTKPIKWQWCTDTTSFDLLSLYHYISWRSCIYSLTKGFKDPLLRLTPLVSPFFIRGIVWFTCLTLRIACWDVTHLQLLLCEMFAATEDRGRRDHPLSFDIEVVKTTSSLVSRDAVWMVSIVRVFMWHDEVLLLLN